MRVLLLTAYYEPECTAVATYVSNVVHDLARMGCDVQVITPTPTREVDKETKLAYRDKTVELLEDGRLNIRRIRVPFNEPRNTVGRALRYALLMNVLFFSGLFQKTDIILLFSAPPIFGLMGAVLKALKHVPVVYYLQDIFPDSMINSGMANNALLIRAGKWMERVTYRSASRIVVICRDFMENLRRKAVPLSKMDLIYNWVDETAVIPVLRADNRLIERFGVNRDSFIVTYSGNIGHTQNLELLVDAALSLQEYKDIQFIIIGNGSYESTIKEYATDKKARNVQFIPFQPYEDISHVLSLGDIGIIISKKNIGQNSFPSKTWNIMAAGRPLVASFDLESELKTIVEEAGCGIYVPPDDKQALIDAILSLYHNRERCQTLGHNGRQYILDHLTRSAGTGKVFASLQNALKH
jgi:glycosyltransferase involved in cell wall biosynthesis